MANLKDYLVELQIGKSPELETIFNYALKQVFSENYMKKIDTKIRKRIKVKEKVNKNTNVVAWNVGTVIYVNRPVFYNKTRGQQIQYLLHEFMHVLHHEKSFMIARTFPEMKALSKNLWKILKSESTDIGKFLTGQDVNKKLLNSEETISYFMNNKINWRYISPRGRDAFLEEIQASKIFNLQGPFWRARLGLTK